MSYMVIEELGFPTTIRFIDAPTNWELLQRTLEIFPPVDEDDEDRGARALGL